jgi:transcriptional regulator with XRE-family HTH domain
MDKEFDKSLGEALRNKRQEKNLSQEYVAQQLGVTKMAVSNWETGKRSMYAETRRRYCALLGVTIQSIFDEMEY